SGLTITVTGDATGSYTLIQPTVTGRITPKELTVEGITAADKVYDGDTGATLMGTSTANLFGQPTGALVTLVVATTTSGVFAT
ncbi:MAG: YDG domain-containing protein, partial [Nitrospinaceae bacterium]|nr:YDG domain-containing protein [Nitrospinaceae bacterium]